MRTLGLDICPHLALRYWEAPDALSYPRAPLLPGKEPLKGRQALQGRREDSWGLKPCRSGRPAPRPQSGVGLQPARSPASWFLRPVFHETSLWC